MPKYYLLDENKNLVEGFDKEGFLALLEQAIQDGSLENIDENSAVASKLRSVLNGTTHNIEFVTEAQYNQLEAQGELVPNTYYFITDDTTLEGLEATLTDAVQRLTSVEEDISKIIDGRQAVAEATHAINSDNATHATSSASADVANGTNYKECSALSKYYSSATKTLTLLDVDVEADGRPYEEFVTDQISAENYRGKPLLFQISNVTNSNGVRLMGFIDKVMKANASKPKTESYGVMSIYDALGTLCSCEFKIVMTYDSSAQYNPYHLLIKVTLNGNGNALPSGTYRAHIRELV